MITKNLSTLKINKLTQAQYERELEAGNIDENALYLTPDDEDYVATAKTYTDEAVAAVKNDLLNGAGTAYDTLKELGDLIDDNTDAIEALETIATGKANAVHTHTASEISDLAENLLDLTYPIGAIYLSVNNTSPASLFGGTWEQIKDRFLLAAGSTYSAGATGGSANHTLSAAQMPSVTGRISFHGKYTGNMVAGASGAFYASSTISGKYATGTSTGSSANSIEVIEFDNGGQGKAHNNMPPYLAVYI